jgi:hypothetical protein
VASHALWRNVCSAILDRAVFPQLASTPLWLKVLFAMLAVVPSRRDRLLDVMLWIQLQVIFAAHDTHLYHGCVPVTWLWLMPFSNVPDWARRWQVQSYYVIARVVMTVAY